MTLALATVLAVASLAVFGRGSHAPSEDQVLKAAYIYNFAKFVTWPEDSFKAGDDRLRLCSNHSDDLGGALSTLSQRSAQGRALEVRYLADRTTAADSGCHIFYVDNKRDNDQPQPTGITEGPVLTIGTAESAIDSNIIIVFEEIDNKLRFSINLKAARHQGLDISSLLLNLALEVYE